MAALSKILGQRRDRTTADKVTIPYRHGILHGSDLGYDNKPVAAKAWAALFAAREWALKVERRQVEPPPPRHRPGWKDLFRHIRENEAERRRLEAWTPRQVRIGDAIPASGDLDLYAQGTPERALAEFLASWRAGNYGRMAGATAVKLKLSINAIAGDMRSHYSTRQILAFEILEISDGAPALTEIRAKLTVDEVGGTIVREVAFRMVNQDEAERSVTRGNPLGRWAIFNVYI